MIRSLIYLAFSAVLLTGQPTGGPAHAQTCEPRVVGVPGGPGVSAQGEPNVHDAVVFDDGWGEALFVAGQFHIGPGTATWPEMHTVARYRDGVWTRWSVGNKMQSLAVADFSSVGGGGRTLFACGQPGVHRWNGSAWVDTGLPGVFYKLLFWHDEIGPVLLAAGGESMAQNVWAWRGVGEWSPYAPLTVNSTGLIKNLRLVPEGFSQTVYAIGPFSDVGRGLRSLVRYEAGAWHQAEMPVSPATISDIVVFDDGTSPDGPEVYVAGVFSMNGSPANIARKRGGVWERLGGGILGVGSSGPNLAAVTESGVPRLFVAGTVTDSTTYQGLRVWNGAAWEAPGLFFRGSNYGTVHGVVRVNFEGRERTLILGHFSGSRFHMQNSNVVFPLNGMAWLEGAELRCLAMGLGHIQSTSADVTDYDLVAASTAAGPRLLAGGYFARAGGRFAYGAAEFDGEEWSPRSLPYTLWLNQSLRPLRSPAIGMINGQQTMVGFQDEFSSFPSIIYWTGTTWQSMGSVPALVKLFNFDGGLYAVGAGLYRHNGTSWQLLAGGVSAVAVATGDIGDGPQVFVSGSGPEGLGVYVYEGNFARVGPTLPAAPTSIHIHDDGTGSTVYAAGENFPGVVVRLENGAWVAVGGGMTLGSQFTPIAFETFDDGRGPGLYVAGPITYAGPNGSSRLDGFGVWRNGAWNKAVVNAYLGPISSIRRARLAVFGDRLYLAGEFVSLNTFDIAADHLAYIERCPPPCSTSDFDGDGDSGTDADIEAFFACLAGDCCAACWHLGSDFDGDGDAGTDADIEAFFRVLAGGSC